LPLESLRHLDRLRVLNAERELLAAANRFQLSPFGLELPARLREAIAQIIDAERRLDQRALHANEHDPLLLRLRGALQ